MAEVPTPVLSIVVPCYNEEQRLPRTIEQIERYLDGKADAVRADPRRRRQHRRHAADHGCGGERNRIGPDRGACRTIAARAGRSPRAWQRRGAMRSWSPTPTSRRRSKSSTSCRRRWTTGAGVAIGSRALRGLASRDLAADLSRRSWARHSTSSSRPCCCRASGTRSAASSSFAPTSPTTCSPA